MRHLSVANGLVAFVGLGLLVGLGCSANAPAPKAEEKAAAVPHSAAKPPVETPPSDDEKSHRPKYSGKKEAGAVIQAAYAEELPAGEMPKIVMTAGHAAMC